MHLFSLALTTWRLVAAYLRLSVRELFVCESSNLLQSLTGSLCAQKDSAVLPDDVQFSLSTLAAFDDVDAKAVDLTERGGHVAVSKQVVPGSNRPYYMNIHNVKY